MLTVLYQVFLLPHINGPVAYRVDRVKRGKLDASSIIF